MKVREYSVKDHKFAFSEPFQAPDDAVAKRYFSMIVNSGGDRNIMAFAPADFDLYCIAEFDTESGQVTPIYPVEFVTNGQSVVGD